MTRHTPSPRPRLPRGAWFIQNALGLYPLSPSSGDYILSSPLFANVSITIDGGAALNVVAVNQGPGNVYVTGVTWNGAPVQGMYVAYADLMLGGTLQFTMSNTSAHK
jgi:putative alpha-1,2-mannosidase